MPTLVRGGDLTSPIGRRKPLLHERVRILSGAPFTVKAGHHGVGFDVSLNESFRKSLFRAENADFVRADHHAIDEEMQTAASELLCRAFNSLEWAGACDPPESGRLSDAAAISNGLAQLNLPAQLVRAHQPNAHGVPVQANVESHMLRKDQVIGSGYSGPLGELY